MLPFDVYLKPFPPVAYDSVVIIVEAPVTQIKLSKTTGCNISGDTTGVRIPAARVANCNPVFAFPRMEGVTVKGFVWILLEKKLMVRCSW